MMMGSLEEAIAGAQTKPDVGDEVVNDLDIEEEEVDVENQEVRRYHRKYCLAFLSVVLD